MIKLVSPYTLEFASEPFAPEDGKVYFVSTEINPAADRFVEDNLEELKEIFANEGLEFVFVRGKIGKDVKGRDVPPTVFSYGRSTETDGGVAFSAYHVNLEKDGLESVILTELFDVAKIYSRRHDLDSVSYSYIPKDPETMRLLYEMERVKRALRKKGVDPDSYNQPQNNQPPQRGLIVDSNGVLIVPEYGDAQIKLNPREKTLYLFFLRHPEGIAPDALVGHRNELLWIYKTFTIFDDEIAIEGSIDSLLEEDKKALYTNVSRINSKIKTKIGEITSKPYMLRFIYRTGLYQIDVASESIRWDINL